MTNLFFNKFDKIISDKEISKELIIRVFSLKLKSTNPKDISNILKSSLKTVKKNCTMTTSGIIRKPLGQQKIKSMDD